MATKPTKKLYGKQAAYYAERLEQYLDDVPYGWMTEHEARTVLWCINMLRQFAQRVADGEDKP